jgi:tRNA nucleotidyltransferase/poly(A) polymerase
MKNFQQYAQLRESEENKNPSEKKTLNAKIALGDGNDYEPFFVSDDPSSEHYGKNKGLAPVIRAFKKGANWGWSKDPKDGSDKPVKIGSKKLYLTGGAVRDHLAGRTPRNIELATDASPDEIFHILKQNEFSFVDSDKSNKGQTFSIKTKDKNGRPFSYNINVDGNVYELEVFTKTPKGSEEPEPGTHADDASGRDFTLNAMSILLSSDNGPNKELNDFYGGLHHMASKKIQPIGDMKDSFSKDPKKIVRFARMVGNYGDIDSISGDEKNTIKSLITLLKKLKPEEITDEFKKGIKKDDVDSRKYLKTFGDLGLLNFVFPEQTVGESFPIEVVPKCPENN